MALQIKLPGQGGISRTTIGIDLGTTHSLVATVKDNSPTVLTGADNDPIVPSVVAYRDASVFVGKAAIDQALEHPAETLFSIKRLMGRAISDPEIALTTRGHQLIDQHDGIIRIHVNERTVTPVEVSAEILKELRVRAEKALKRRVTQAVITVPAYFDDAQRQATRDAGRLAGLEVLRLLNEPTAAALAYGLEQNREGIFAIYDLGGGTFDISILKLEAGVFEVLSTGGNTHLGGDDFDEVIATRFEREAGYDADRANIPTRTHRLMRRIARSIKETLTEYPVVVAQIPRPNGGELERTLTREELEQWVLPIVEQTGIACQQAMQDAKVTPETLDGLVLVGGATRMPIVRQYVAGLFKRAPFTGVDPDQVVALGAAIQAALLSGWKKDVLLLDVIALSLGIETMGGIVEKLIHRNSTVPASASQVFTTFAEGQTAMDIHIVQGEREMVRDCRSLAQFRLRGIPALPAGVARIEVTFAVDSDGILRVSAKEQRTGVEQRVEVRPSYGLSDQEVERMLREALQHAEQDVQERLLRDARVEAERILTAAEHALAQDGDLLLCPGERAPIESAIRVLREASNALHHAVIRESIEKLDQITAPFAQRRMEEGIRRALSGADVNQLAEELASVPPGGQPH